MTKRMKQIPKAARVAKPRKTLADTMSTVEMAAHRRRNGIVLLPLGCVEMHGVSVGLACDSFAAEAACRVLAEAWDAVVLPTIHYTYAGATSRWAGSVSILPTETVAQIVMITKSILRNGFKRVVLVNLHGPSDLAVKLAIRTVFEETGGMPILFTPDYDGEFCGRVLKEWSQPHNEAALYLASLYICGRHGEFDPESEGAGAVGRTYPMESLRTLAKHGVAAPLYYGRPEDHVGLYRGLKLEDAPRVAKIYREVILERAKGLPEDYERYQKDLRRMIKRAPWDHYE